MGLPVAAVIYTHRFKEEHIIDTTDFCFLLFIEKSLTLRTKLASNVDGGGVSTLYVTCGLLPLSLTYCSIPLFLGLSGLNRSNYHQRPLLAIHKQGVVSQYALSFMYERPDSGTLILDAVASAI
jgi:hypothetical protein